MEEDLDLEVGSCIEPLASFRIQPLVGHACRGWSSEIIVHTLGWAPHGEGLGKAGLLGASRATDGEAIGKARFFLGLRVQFADADVSVLRPFLGTRWPSRVAPVRGIAWILPTL